MRLYDLEQILIDLGNKDNLELSNVVIRELVKCAYEVISLNEELAGLHADLEMSRSYS